MKYKKKSGSGNTVKMLFATRVNLYHIPVWAELQDKVMDLGLVKRKIYKTVTAKTQKQTKGLYPAPTKIIEVNNLVTGGI